MPILDGTTIIYNGVEIKNVATESIDIEPMKDSFGQVDIVGIRVRMAFTGVIHCSTGSNCRGYRIPNASAGQCDNGGGSNLGPGLAAMIESFLLPRCELKVFLGGEILWHITPPSTEHCKIVNAVGTDLEINNGPTTKLRVLSVQYDYSVRAAFEIEFVKAVRCNGRQGQILQDVQNLRYVVDEDIDCTTWLRTRTYRGKLRVYALAGDDVDGNGAIQQVAIINPYALGKWLAMPPLQYGFRRESVRYALSENGLELSFFVADKEQKSAAPYPACNWEGSFAIQFPEGEVICDSTLEFTLTAAPEFRKIELYNLAYRIFEAKTKYFRRLTNHWSTPDEWTGSVYVTSHEIAESLKDNTIRASWRLRNFTPREYASNLRALDPSGENMICQDLPSSVVASHDYNPLIATDPPDSLGELRGLFICALQNPCCPQRMPEQSVESGAPLYAQIQKSSPPAEYAGSYTDEKYSTAHKERMYQWYKLSSELVGDSGWRGFPLGAQCQSSGSQATAAFAQIHCPVAVRHVRIHALRVDEFPQLPRLEHWTDRYRIRHVLAHYKIEPCPPAFSADGDSRLHEVYADYYYYLDRPPDVTSSSNEGILAGVLPYTTNIPVPKEVSAIGSDKFIDPKEILDTGQNT